MADALSEPGDDELAPRRRELELEFDSKLRDLKSQIKRQSESLRQEQADWENHRRQREKDLADRTEKVRRREQNLEKEATELQQDQIQTKEQAAGDIDAVRRAAAEAQAQSQQRIHGLERSLGTMRALAWLLVVVAAAAAGLGLVVHDATVVAAGCMGALALTAFLAWRTVLVRP